MKLAHGKRKWSIIRLPVHDEIVIDIDQRELEHTQRAINDLAQAMKIPSVTFKNDAPFVPIIKGRKRVFPQSIAEARRMTYLEPTPPIEETVPRCKHCNFRLELRYEQLVSGFCTDACLKAWSTNKAPPR